MGVTSDSKQYGLTPEQQKLDKSTLLRLDILLVPMCCMIHLLAFLDRTNTGHARITGLQKDLKLMDKQYQTGQHFSILPNLPLTQDSHHSDLCAIHSFRDAQVCVQPSSSIIHVDKTLSNYGSLHSIYDICGIFQPQY